MSASMGRSIPLDLLPLLPSVLGLLILLMLHPLTYRSMQKFVDLSVEAREPRAGFGLVSPCPSWGGCYGTALAVDRLRCGVTKGGRSAAAGVEASKEAHAYATRGSTSLAPSPNVSLVQSAFPLSGFDLHRPIFILAGFQSWGRHKELLREKSGLKD